MDLNTLNFDFDKKEADKALITIKKSNLIGIISHRHPDPDTIGANLALKSALKQFGQEVDSICVHQPPKTCQSLIGADQYINELDINKYDLIISVDCGSLSQVAFTNITDYQGEYINIDHHASNNNFGTINLVNSYLSSTAEILFLLLTYWGFNITKDIATNLLFGLYYDTGSFMHSNINAQVLNIASFLLEQGASIQEVHQNMYCNFNLTKFHLWGQTLENISVNKDQTSIAFVGQEDFKKFNANQEDISGIIDYISMVDNSNYAVLINQDSENHIKGSLRTRKDGYNLSDLAGTMGGGGHRKASGFGFEGKIEKKYIWNIKN